jgi:hypothetical protein
MFGIFKNLDNNLIWIIRDIIYGTPKDNYNKVVNTLNTYFKSQCGIFCRINNIFQDNMQFKLPVFFRSTQRECIKCLENYTSRHYFRYCYACVEKIDEEYVYYHSCCRNFDIDNYYDITTNFISDGYNYYEVL